MPLVLNPLPFAHDALAPTMSEDTLKTHHGKHHAKYVKTVNDMIADTPYAEMSLDEIVLASHKKKETKLFNNAAQAWNHDFFWNSLTDDYASPPKKLAEAIERDFDSMDGFRKAFVAKGEGHFGSGWIWLIADGGKLSLVDTHDADTPLVHGKTAILTCDVWEHAYYLDTKNDRNAYLTGFFTKLANWKGAAERLAKA